MKRMTFLLVFLLIGCASKNTSAKKYSCKHTNEILRCASYVKNYDGDTITFNIPAIHSLIGKNISVRIKGIDTPEIRGATKCEKEMAEKAKKLVANMLIKAKNIELRHVKRGKYFRIIADIIVDGRSVGKELINSNLAYPYFGNTKKEINWCFKKQRI